MTKETKHTPAPWYAVQCDEYVYSICTKPDDCYDFATTGLGEDVDNKEAIEANAHLIAAAPELLDTIKDLLNHHLHDSHGCEVSPELQKKLNNAHDAVAKAEGR